MVIYIWGFLLEGEPDTVERCRQCLSPKESVHAHRIKFVHPLSRAEVVVEAPLPPDLAAFVAHLGAPRAA